MDKTEVKFQIKWSVIRHFDSKNWVGKVEMEIEIVLKSIPDLEI